MLASVLISAGGHLLKDWEAAVQLLWVPWGIWEAQSCG